MSENDNELCECLAFQLVPNRYLESSDTLCILATVLHNKVFIEKCQIKHQKKGEQTVVYNSKNPNWFYMW